MKMAIKKLIKKKKQGNNAGQHSHICNVTIA